MSVNLHEVHIWDKRSRTVTLFVDQKHLEPHILCTGLLNVEDFKTLTVWQRSDSDIIWGFGFQVEEGHRVAMQHVAVGLSRTSQTAARASAASSPFVCSAREDVEGKQLHCLQILQLKGLTMLLSQDATSTSWSLTPSGSSALRLTRRYHNPKRFLNIRSEKPIRERTAWELAAMLGDDGWVCRVGGTHRTSEVEPEYARPDSN